MGVARLSDVVRAFGTTRLLVLNDTFLCVRTEAVQVAMRQTG